MNIDMRVPQTLITRMLGVDSLSSVSGNTMELLLLPKALLVAFTVLHQLYTLRCD